MNFFSYFCLAEPNPTEMALKMDIAFCTTSSCASLIATYSDLRDDFIKACTLVYIKIKENNESYLLRWPLYDQRLTHRDH